MTEENEGKGLKVNDKRRFDSGGNERGSESQRPKTSEAKQPAAMEKQSDPVASQEAGELQINFSSFVMSLATQALMQLGEMKPPPGLEISVDREAARQTIDILSLLQAKTKGNLDAGEAKLMEEILHTLRVSYVKLAK